MEYDVIDTNEFYNGNIKKTGEKKIIDLNEKCLIGKYCDRNADIVLGCNHYYCLKCFIDWYYVGNNIKKCCYCGKKIEEILYFGRIKNEIKMK